MWNVIPTWHERNRKKILNFLNKLRYFKVTAVVSVSQVIYHDYVYYICKVLNQIQFIMIIIVYLCTPNIMCARSAVHTC